MENKLVTVKLDDGKQLAIFTVEVADSISIVATAKACVKLLQNTLTKTSFTVRWHSSSIKNQVDYRFLSLPKKLVWIWKQVNSLKVNQTQTLHLLIGR